MAALYKVVGEMQAVIAFGGEAVYIGLNGTRGLTNWADWLRNFTIFAAKFEHNDGGDHVCLGHVHRGKIVAWNM